MRLSTVFAAVAALATAVTAAPTARDSVLIGKRNIILPSKCEWKDAKDNNRTYTIDTADIKRALTETRDLIGAAIVVHPDSYNHWFTKLTTMDNYETFLRLGQAASTFASPQELFSTINIVCPNILVDRNSPNGTEACLHNPEADGSPRLMIADVENDIIHLCPALFRNPNKRMLINSKPDADVTYYCANHGSETLNGARPRGLEKFGNFWATPMAREIVHTGSTIRKASKELRYDDLELHKFIERIGWMFTLAYWERRCDYEIPVYKEFRDQFKDY
ncbi:hypothetical protein EDC01DRAFT_673796 [Geopyxis carbonaria]|nr:hypothetical protein EDC01DRAFT_673796 [Geopyxis carbonaria]